MSQNGNPYDVLIDEDVRRRQSQLAGSLSSAVESNPDQVSAQRRVATYLGYPLAAVEAMPKELNLQAAVKQVTEATAKAPALQNKYLDPEFAKLAHDDAGKLSEIEQAVRKYGELKAWTGPKPTVGSFFGGLADSLPQGLRSIREGLRQEMGDLFDTLGILPRTEQEKAEQLRRTARAQGASAYTDPEFETATMRGIYGGLTSVLRQAPGIALSVVTGNPTPALASIGVQTQAEAYGKYRTRGATPGEAFVGSTAEAGVEVATELLPMSFLVNKLGKTGMTEFFTGLLAREIPGEQIATLLQDAVDTAIANPDKTWADYLNERPEAAYQTLVATITQSAVMGGVSAAARRALRDTNQINDAETDAQQLAGLFTAAGQSKLRERDPASFADLVQGVADQTDGAPKSVFIDAEVLAEALQNPQAAEVFNQMPQEVLDQLPEALATGGTVELPIGELIARATGTPLEQALLPNLRAAPDALSQLEAQEVAGQAETYLQNEASRVIEEATNADAMRASADAVKANVLGQLTATKRFKPEVNESYASLAGAFYTTMAGRLGTTPEEMFARYPLRIVSKLKADGSAGYNAAGARVDQTETPEFKAWFGESAVKDAEGRPLVVYHGAPDARFAKPGEGEGVFKTKREAAFGKDPERAFFFAADPRVARTYADPRRAFDYQNAEEGLVPAFLSLQNPMVIDAKGAHWRDTAAAMAAAREAGHDGVIIRNSRDTYMGRKEQRGVPMTDVYVAFNPEQIKSATNNRGTFDPNDPSVFNQRGEQKPGKPVPTTVDAVANVESAFELANGQQFKTNRDLKLALQDRVLEALKAAKVNLEDFNAGAEQYLVRVALMDAEVALTTNPNAVGWYNEKVTKALRLVALVHPEIETDPQAKFAFVWAMAVTSNGLKVDKNFELAEQAYSTYKSTGKMPTDIQAGQAQAAINNGLALFNEMLAKHGFEQLQSFMTTKATVKEIQAFSGLEVGGENLTTEVYGSAILGPKIGNGFFSNLYGRFEQLTMDRWLMRTWGRWTGTLVETNPTQVRAKRTQLRALIQGLDKDQKKAFETIIKRKLTVGDPDAVALAIWKASQKPINRARMAEVADATDSAGQARLASIMGPLKKGQKRLSFGDELRKVGNSLTKYNDGQKEAPSGPPERGRIRKVFAQTLEQLQQRYPALTMSDLQALLWYPEKRLYDAAKEAGEGETGYEDDAAPDYANAAAKLAREKGVSDEDIARTMKEVDDELRAAVSAAGAGRTDRGEGAPGQAAEGGVRQPDGVRGGAGLLEQQAGVGAPDSLSQGDQAPRGTFNPSILEITLLEDANLSTFLHEMGHFFLEVQADLASQPGAPQQVVDDFETTLKWFGVKGKDQTPAETWRAMTLDQKRPYHERWAESFEQYLFEGKAPSVEMRGVFQRFREFMISAYKSLKNFLRMRSGTVGGQAGVFEQAPKGKALLEWYGEESNLRNPDGTPMVLYHGTTKQGARKIKQAGQMRRSSFGAMGSAIYLGDSAEASSGYDQGAMLRVYARGKYLTNMQWTEYVNRHGWKGAEQAARADGWAGVYDTKFENAVAVWDPANIKAVEAKWFAEGGSMYEQPAYHGTPYRGIEKFDTSKIGTGEGAQAYGWGLYFAGAKDVAEFYRKTLSVRNGLTGVDGKRYGVAQADAEADAIKLLTLYRQEPKNFAQYLDGGQSYLGKIARDIKSGKIKANEGQLYEVDIPEDSEMLLWDKPLSEQPAKVREAVTDVLQVTKNPDPAYSDEKWLVGFGDGTQDTAVGAYATKREAEAARGMMTGRQLYTALEPSMGARAASQFLAQRGIKGIKYLDGTSRAAGDGSYNYVVFSGDDVAIRDTFYQSATPGNPLGLSDEVRGVFDRLIATDEQIAEAQSLANFEAVFKSAEQAGMTPEEWAAYQAQNAAATAEATETLQKKSLADMKWVAAARGKALRKAQAEVKDKRDAMRAEVTAEVEALPIEQARAYIKALRVSTPEQKDALKDWGDRRAAALERAQEEVKAALLASPEAADLKGIKKGQFLAKNKKLLDNQAEAKVIAWEQENPRPTPALPEPQMETIAEQFGFTSGDELRRALVEQPPAAQFIDALTEQRLLETYGELVTADGMARAANEAVHNEARRRFVATELAAMQRAMSATAPTGKTDRKGRPLGVNVIVQAAKSFARTVVDRRRILDLKPAQHAAAATRAAARSAKLQAEGKTADAIGAKRDQLLSEYTARYTADAAAEVERGLAYLRKFDKASVREKLPVDYVDQIDQMLERFELKTSTTARELDRRANLAAWVAQQQEMGLDPVVPEDLLANTRLTSYKQMTVEEFRGLVDGVKNVEHLARLKSKLLAAKDKREFDAIADEITASIIEHGGKPREVQLEPDGRVAKFFKGAWADHRKLNSLIRQMDGGKDNGPFYRALVRSMNDAGARENTMLEQATEALAKIYAPIEALPGGFTGAKVFIPEINNSLSRAGRLSIALNWGNPQNRQRVMDGDGWTEAQVNAILRTLTPVELKFVNDVWAHLDSYWPEIKAKQERVSGVVEDKVEAVPFEIKLPDATGNPEGTVVQMRGGYYPIKYDTERSIKAEKQEALETARQIMQGAVARPTTRRGHTKARVDEVKGRPVLKDLRAITQHVNQVVHDLAWHEWFIDANRLLNDKRIAGAIRQYHGNDTARVLKEAADAIAVGDTVHQGQIDRLLLMMRANVTRSIMGASLTTALLQPFGLTQSMARVGVVPVLKGAARWAGEAARMESTVGWINEKSEFMRLRSKTFNRELREISQRVQGKSKILQVYDASLFMLMQKLQMVADVPTWVGAYEKALAGGVDESTAVALADEAVLGSQGGGTTKDLSAVQRNMPFLTQFYSYFNTTLNLVVEQTATTNFKNPKAVAGWMADMALLAVIPAILPALLTHLLKGGGEDDEPEDWAKKMLEWQAGYMFGMFVGLRELPTLWSPFDYAGPPAAKVLTDAKKVVQQANQGEVDDPAVLATISLLGTVFGIPTVQIIRSYKGWQAWSDGDAPASSILFGPPPRD